MTPLSYAEIDLVRRGITPCIDVMQDDKYSRNILIGLYHGSIDWDVPEGTTVVIHYSKADGTGGTYDKLPDGSKAYATDCDLLKP